MQMPQPKVPLNRLFFALVVVTAPTAAAVFALVVAGKLDIPLALVIVAFVAVTGTVLVRPYLADVRAAARYVRQLADGETPTAPVFSYSTSAEDLISAAVYLRRTMQAKAIEAELRLGEEEALLDSLPDPLMVLDRQGRIQRANKAARKLFLGDRPEGDRTLEGLGIAALIRDPLALEAIDEVLYGGAGRTVDILLMQSVELSFNVRIEPLRTDRTPESSAILISLHDQTALKRADQMRADFVANASHELRTPLASVMGFIETLQGPARDDPEAAERFLDIMSGQAQRMARLIQDLLSLSRIEMNEHLPPTEKVDIRYIAETVADTLRPQAEANQMTVTVTATPDEKAWVLGNADELTQVLQNLIDNALKYGRNGSEVTVSVEAGLPAPQGHRGYFPSGAARVSVTDRGDGIAPEHLPRLTERFYRVDTARSRQLGGTGLGLAIVKHIVNRHRGVFAVDSEPGTGSTFSIYLAQPDAGD
jgi:two-component system phosphate regulon sensor histidine kinase PhoR